MLSITLLHINSKTVLSLCPRGEKRAKRTERATDATLAGSGRLGSQQEVRASRHSGHQLALKSVGQFYFIPSFPSFCQLITPQGHWPHGLQPVHELDSPEKK